MKRKNLLMVALAGIFLFPSCSNDVDTTSGIDMGGITFSIDAQAKLQTRSSTPGYTEDGRLLWSSEAKHEVINMNVFAFKKNDQGEFIFHPHTTGMWGDILVPWEFGVSKKEYTIKPRLSAGEYKFIALGRDNGARWYGEHFFDNKKIQDVDFYLGKPYADAPKVYITKEAFVGSSEVLRIVDNEQVKVNITLNRMVAGVLGYFTNIPAQFNGKKASEIQIVAFEKINTSINPLTLEGSIPSTYANDEVIMQLSIPKEATINENGIYEFQQVEQGVAILPNSLLGGAFMLPKRNASQSSTFKVNLLAEDGTVLKTWNAKIKTQGSSSLVYDINANNFYSFGRKISDSTTNPGTPDIDKPIDLSKDQDLIITVNPNWDTVHDMELE